MAETPGKSSGRVKPSEPRRKAPASEAKGVALTAAQALQAAEQATGDAIAQPETPAAVPLVTAAPMPLEPSEELGQPAPAAEPISAAPIETTKPEAAAEPAPAAVEGTNIMNEVLEAGKKYSEDAKARFQSAFADINEKAKAGVEKSTKALEEISDLAKGNVEALVESSRIAVKGVETLGQDAAEYGRLSFEKATATMKSLAAVKTPAEFFQLQSELFSSAFDGFAREAAKNSETVLKLAGEVVQPLSSRVSVVTEKVKSLAA